MELMVTLTALRTSSSAKIHFHKIPQVPSLDKILKMSIIHMFYPPQMLQIGHMTTRDSTGKPVTSLPIDTIATLVGQNTILGADIELWCKVSKVDPAALYNRVAKNAREKLRLNA